MPVSTAGVRPAACNQLKNKLVVRGGKRGGGKVEERPLWCARGAGLGKHTPNNRQDAARKEGILRNPAKTNEGFKRRKTAVPTP